MPLLHRYSFGLGLFLLAACGSVRSDADDTLFNPSLDAGDGEDGEAIGDAKAPDIDDASPEADVIDANPDEDESEDDPDFGLPDCADVEIPPEPPVIECDALAEPASSGCGLHAACTPYVINAPVDCGQPSYGTACFPAGTGQQGSACGSTFGCRPGFMCVVSGAGRQCTKICEPESIGSCEDGLVCLPIDNLPGFGGCL